MPVSKRGRGNGKSSSKGHSRQLKITESRGWGCATSTVSQPYEWGVARQRERTKSQVLKENELVYVEVWYSRAFGAIYAIAFSGGTAVAKESLFLRIELQTLLLHVVGSRFNH